MIHGAPSIRRFLVILPMVIVTSICSASQPLQLGPLPLQPLQPKQGYLLINLDANGVAPSLHIKKLKGRKPTRKKPTYTVRVKDVAEGFSWLTLDEGSYEFTRINVPYFDLPYQLDTSGNLLWRFNIEAGRVNYLGKLFIDGRRSVNAVNVQLLNRISADLRPIQNEFSEILKDYPLRHAVDYPDEFLTMLEASDGEK